MIQKILRDVEKKKNQYEIKSNRLRKVRIKGGVDASYYTPSRIKIRSIQRMKRSRMLEEEEWSY